MLIFRAWLMCVASVAVLWAAEPEAPKTEPAKVASVGAVPEEEKWIFEPTGTRTDVFFDIEKRLELEVSDPSSTQTSVVAIKPLDNPQEKIDAAIEWGAREADRIEALILVRKWDETIQACDNAVKNLEKYQSNAPVADLIERFKRYRSQAEEAKIYEEAQAKFDALGLKIEGILWSPEGSLAVIGGEPRALKINDRAKDCVIINIDTNRVDFLFHYNRRRFEFQRYVGEVANASRAH